MKANKNLVFLIGAVVFAVILAVSAFLLVRGLLNLSSTESELKARKAALDGHYANNPFPSPGNVQREKENGEALLKWFKELIGLASQGQVQPSERSPSNFMSLLGDKRGQLSLLATNNNVSLAKEFAFGFDRYFAAGSTLPAPEDVPRLTEQLLIIDRLCTTLFDQRITELLDIEREEFEAAPSGAKKARRVSGRAPMQGTAVAGAGLMEKDELFGRMHFVVEMRAREKALMAVLNRLAANEVFIVVTGLSIERDAAAVKQAAVAPARRGAPEADGAAETPAAPLSRSERVVSGLEVESPMKVTLDLDVFRFRESK